MRHSIWPETTYSDIKKVGLLVGNKQRLGDMPM